MHVDHFTSSERFAPAPDAQVETQAGAPQAANAHANLQQVVEVRWRQILE
jgi:hypothetical protein